MCRLQFSIISLLNAIATSSSLTSSWHYIINATIPVLYVLALNLILFALLVNFPCMIMVISLFHGQKLHLINNANCKYIFIYFYIPNDARMCSLSATSSYIVLIVAHVDPFVNLGVNSLFSWFVLHLNCTLYVNILFHCRKFI